MLELQGESIGVPVDGLAVINKSMCLTVSCLNGCLNGYVYLRNECSLSFSLNKTVEGCKEQTMH